MNLTELKFFNELDDGLYFDSEKMEVAFSNIESAKTFKTNFPSYKVIFKVEIVL